MICTEDFIKDLEVFLVRYIPLLEYVKYFNETEMEFIKLLYNDTIIHLEVTGYSMIQIITAIIDAINNPKNCMDVVDYETILDLREVGLIEDTKWPNSRSNNPRKT